MARKRGSTYSEKWGDKIIDEILDGKSINQIGNTPLPHYTHHIQVA